MELSERDSGEFEEDQKYKFKWAYFWRLLEINKKYKKHYIIGILGAMLLGAIFPSFSVILSSLVNLSVEVESATDPAERESLANHARFISIFLFVLAFLNLVMIIVK